MKKFLQLLAISLLAIGLLVACADNEDNGNSNGNNDDNGSENENGGDELSGTITMAGSTSVQPLSEELAQAFMDIHPDTRLEVQGGGSGAGITAAQENSADFGAVSREVRDDETGINTYTIAIDGIAIIVHPDNEIEDLTMEQVQQIFSGEIANWSEVGGPDEDIVVVSREEGSGTRGAFDDIVLGDESLVTSALIQNSTGAVTTAVSSEVNAIGYASTGSLNDSIKTISVDGVEPTEENIVAGDYSVARPFNYVSYADEELSDLAQAFLDFVLSEDGQKVVVEQGYVAVE